MQRLSLLETLLYGYINYTALGSAIDEINPTARNEDCPGLDYYDERTPDERGMKVVMRPYIRQIMETLSLPWRRSYTETSWTC